MFENFEQNQDFSEISTKIGIFRKFWSKVLKIATKIEIYGKFRPK